MKNSNLITTIVGLFLVFLISKCLDKFKSSKETKSNNYEKINDNKSDAYVISTNFVEDYLKNPSKSDFPYTYTSIREYQDTFVITSYVDATNGFGANIRENYLCHIVYKRFGQRLRKESYTLLFLKIGEDVMYADAGMLNKYISK